MSDETPMGSAPPAPAGEPQPSSRLSVQSVNPVTMPDWDARIASLPGASVFHTAGWARVLQGTYGYTPRYFIVTHGETGAMCACLPLMEVDSWLTGRRGVGLPFTDESPPLCSDEASFRAALAAALAFGRERGWKYLECRGGRALFGDAPSSTSFYSHRLDLGVGEDRLFNGTDAAVRRAIRKAEKGDLSVTNSNDTTAMDTFYRLQCLTRRRHGLPPQPVAFFRSIHREVIAPGRGEVVLASLGSVPVAGAVFLRFADTVIYKFGASDDRFQHLRANNLVMWEAIRRHVQQGYRWFDFGRTSLANEGLRRFKLSWGAVERVADYVRLDCRSGTYVTAPDRVAGWHNRVFRALPVSASRLIGTVLYRHIA